jgi:hypothetical protein
VFFSYEVLQGDGPVFPEEQDTSKHTMAAIVHGTYHREMHSWDSGGERRIRGEEVLRNDG